MLTPSNQYLQAVEEINDYVNQAKCRASVSVNSEIMKTNIFIGNVIIRTSEWGNKFVENLSKDMKMRFPSAKGYSVRNLKYMKKFAQTFTEDDVDEYGLGRITFVRPVIGSKRISTLKKSDIKKYYNYLVDERNLKPSTIDNIHTVLHQVLQIAVDDDFIRNNPSDNVLRELKKAHCFQSEKRRALTKPEQELFLNFLKTHPVYEH